MTDISEVRAPAPDPGWALFLDIDGTLLEIAPTPEQVQIPATLVATLAQASAWLSGALAIVSGRPFSQIDKMLAPLRLPGGAGHGASLRLPDGRIETASTALAVPSAWRTLLHQAVKQWPGVVVEDKPHCIAVHYRGAPDRKKQIEEIVAGLVARDEEAFEVLPAKKAFEIRHRTLTKAMVVRSLMANPPFRGRVPVFVGDDVTDHDGFRAAKEKGGIALDVGIAFGGRPAAVRAWLARFHNGTD
ncbi:MAG: trehalose-phosphatase [Proteobacteria bacterium]|nr:trehalose-phosphatase [Pseudomonadota bacterium]